MATTAVQTAGTVGALSHLLTQYKEQIRLALPKHMTPERMIRVALSAVSGNKQLMECDALSIAACVVQSSIMGLEPNALLGESYLVPFKNKKLNNGRGGYQAQLIVGYKGLLKLVRNTGQLSMVDAQLVYENDVFEYEKGLSPWLKHKRAMTDRGEVIGAWAGYVLKDGAKNFEFMTKAEIIDHRDRYSKGAYDSDGNLTGAWQATPEWMYKKTVLRQLAKLMPMSVEAQTAVALDEAAEAGLPQRFSVEVPLELTPAQPDDAPEKLEAPQPRRKSEAQQPKLDDWGDPVKEPQA